MFAGFVGNFFSGQGKMQEFASNKARRLQNPAMPRIAGAFRRYL